jgi:putative (di)nucleoside polyphosphate hydrolase
MRIDKDNKKFNKEYRPCVAIFLVNKDKKVFTGKRIDSDAWQIPQGGIEEGEQIEISLFRELFEETGIKKEKVEIIACHPHEIFYDIPADKIPKSWNDKYCGQKVLCFFLKFLGEDDDIDLKTTDHPEFSEFKWEQPENLKKNNIIDCKKKMYQEIVDYFSEIFEVFSESFMKI